MLKQTVGVLQLSELCVVDCLLNVTMEVRGRIITRTKSFMEKEHSVMYFKEKHIYNRRSKKFAYILFIF